MRALMAAIMSVALVLAFVGTAEAASKRKKHRNYDAYSQRYPYV